MTDKALSLAKKVLKNFSDSETQVRGAVSWAVIYNEKDVETVKKHPGEACFFNLTGKKKGAKYFVFYPFSKRNRTGNDKGNKLEDHELDYIKYIVKQSVFAPCFQTNNAKTIFKRGVILETDMPAQFVYSAATAIRYVSEYPDIITMWSKFREHIGDDAALVLSHLFKPRHGAPEKYISNPYWSSGHQWMSSPSEFGVDEFKRFLERDLTGMNNLPSFSENTNFRGVTRIWKEQGAASRGVPENKKFKWNSGCEKKESHWSNVSIREYDYENLKKDLHAMMEINHA